MARDSTSALGLALDPFGDMAGAGLAGAWTGGDVESILAALLIGAAALLSSIVAAIITALPALPIALGRASVSVAFSKGGRPACARAPLTASITEAQQGAFRPAVRAVSGDFVEAVSVASEAVVSAAEAAVGVNSAQSAYLGSHFTLFIAIREPLE